MLHLVGINLFECMMMHGLANPKSTLLLDSGTDFVLYGGEMLLDKHKCRRLEIFFFYAVQIGAVPLLLY